MQCYKPDMKDSNTYDFETMRQIEVLEKALGGLRECKRLGFVIEDERRILALSPVGLGYLLHVRARGITDVAEAFAAGFECGREEKS